MSARPAPSALLLVASLSLAGCGGRRDVREWSPTDHDRADDSPERRPQPQAPAGAASSGRAAADAMTMVVDVAWQQNCATCHGPEGHGDGPSGPMVKAPDLTRAAWQASTDDAAIAKVIHEGRNRMPKFDLPPDVVTGLIARIRSRRGR